MKKIISTMTLAAAMLLALTALTSCDRDREEAYMLSGEWTGDFGMFYDDGYSGRRFWASYTDIRFLPDYDYATHGTGEEIDFFSRPCPIRYQSFFFYWEIRNGVVYLTFPYSHSLDVAIYDYTLNDSYFAGYFGDSHDWFRLSKLTGYYDWYAYDPYNYYGYGYYDYYGYAKQRGENGDTPAPQGGDPSGFRFGRSMNRDVQP